MADITSEERLGINEVARIEKVHASTAYRWHLKGIRGVRLETFMRGGVRMTSREALMRFFDEITRQNSSNAHSTILDRAKCARKSLKRGR